MPRTATARIHGRVDPAPTAQCRGGQEDAVNLRTIVSLIDFSPTDTLAVAQALSLARWHDADVHLVHVFPSRGGSRPDHASDAHRERMERFVAELKPEGVRVVPVALTGDAAKAITRYSEDVDAEAIVVPQRRRRGYRSAGAFAAALGRLGRTPILAVPSRGDTQTDARALFKNVVAAVDFSEVSLRALDQALTLVQQSQGHLTLLHVLEGLPSEILYSASRAFRLVGEYRARVERVNRELRALVPRDALNWCDVDAVTMSGESHEAILATAADRRADLIVMGLPRKPRLEQLLAGSTVKSVLRRTACAVLLVPGSSAVSAPYSRLLPDHREEFERYSVAPAMRPVAAVGRHEGALSWP